MIVQVQEILHAMMHATQRCLFTSLATASFRKVAFCLTGPYLTRRATIGRLANSPQGLPPGEGRFAWNPQHKRSISFGLPCRPGGSISAQTAVRRGYVNDKCDYRPNEIPVRYNVPMYIHQSYITPN